jgi:glycerophosphoryl diester phosphodiesterase
MGYLEDHLKELGFQTYSVCLYGHGTDPKDLNKVSWKYWMKNLEDGYYSLRKSCKKVFLIGFSMGGCLSLILSSMREKRIDGIVAINPCMGIKDKLNFMVPWAVHWNNTMMRIGLNSLTYKYVASETELPSINYKRNSLHGTNELKKLMKKCWKSLDKVWAPCLVIQEKNDPTVLYDSGVLAFDKISTNDKQFKSTDFGVHATLYMEASRDAIFEIVDGFIDDTLESSFMTIAHRGASGRKNENTLSAFTSAINMGCDMIELDVRNVGGALVVFHDNSLKRIFGIEKDIDECSYGELKNLVMQGGDKIPTLEEALECIGGQTKVNIELKTKDTGIAVAGLLEAYVKTPTWEYSDFLITSFSHNELEQVTTVSDKIPIGLVFDDRGRDIISMGRSLAIAKHLNAWSITVSSEVVTEELIELSHLGGMKVLVYTVNDPDEVCFLKSLGVDGVFSDYPDRAS